MSSLTVAGGGRLRGRLRMPGDKSISHRALLLAALAHGTSVVRGLSNGDDVARTLAAVEALGASVEGDLIRGGDLHEATSVIDVGNSGTTMRLLAGLTAGRPWTTVLDGDASIARRPMERVVTPLRLMGARISGREDGRFAPLRIEGGGLHGVDYELPVASAQVKSAVLLAGLSADGETVVRERVRTRAHTEEMLTACGADISLEDGNRTVRIRPSTLRPLDLEVPGDPSQAAFWVVAACLVPGSDLTVTGTYLGPARDGFVRVLRRMGADVEVEMQGPTTADLRARPAALRATTVAGDEVPGLIDEIPVLAVAAALAAGTSEFRDAGELRVKESDRIATVAKELVALGADVEPRPDGLVVTGPCRLRGTTVDAHGDHRLALALAVAGLAAEGETTIEGWKAVATSYPGFEDDLRRCES